MDERAKRREGRRWQPCRFLDSSYQKKMSQAHFRLETRLLFKRKNKIKQMFVVLPGSYEAAETLLGSVGTLKAQR